jgi:hypothetical protein
MIELLKDVCTVLGRDPLTAREVAEALGTITDAGKLGKPYQVQPYDAALRAVRVVMDNDGSAPAFVELETAVPVDLQALASAFPDYADTPTRQLSVSRQITFYVDLPDLPRTCAIIARIPREGELRTLTVRRDIRLP